VIRALERKCSTCHISSALKLTDGMPRTRPGGSPGRAVLYLDQDAIVAFEYEAISIGPSPVLHLGLNWQQPRKSELIAFQSDRARRYIITLRRTDRIVLLRPIARNRREVP
jgi:hypothetical protein